MGDIFRVLLPHLLLLILSSVRLAEAVQVNFKGTLQSTPPCIITGDNTPITINFGDIGITRIDGFRYAQSFTLMITCDGSLGDNISLYFDYSGINADFDNRALQTSRNGLGIILFNNGEVIKPDKSHYVLVMSAGIPKYITLTAIPIKNPVPRYILYEGDFTATGTVEINYP